MTANEANYVAGMLLGGVGDAMGYKNKEWEFKYSGDKIYDEVQRLGGIDALTIKLPDFRVSDDTVMCLATSEALVRCPNGNREQLLSEIAEKYIECMEDMTERSPSNCTTSSAKKLKPNEPNGYRIPFDEKGVGCGGAMRVCPVGLRFSRPEQLDDLIAISLESARMTHNHPIAYLGAVAAALFTSYAVRRIPLRQWGHNLMELLPTVFSYVSKVGVDVEEAKKHWSYFVDQWQRYLNLRNISDGNSEPVFPQEFGFGERDEFYKSLSHSGWGGSAGHDAPMIAYDALLGAEESWHELCRRAIFHGGDNDTTGILAATWFGVLYGIESVPECNHMNLEYRDRLVDMGRRLFLLQRQ